MKRCILIIVLVMSYLNLFSQTHISRMRGVEINFGTSLKQGINYNIAPSYFIHNKIYLKSVIGVESGFDVKYDSTTGLNTKVNYNLYSLDLMGYYTILNIKKNYSNIGIGISGMYSDVNNIKYTPNQSGFNFGGLISYENEFYFYKRWSYLLTIRQYIYIDNPNIDIDFIKDRLLFTMGIKKVF